jgi:hypothetical protein
MRTIYFSRPDSTEMTYCDGMNYLERLDLFEFKDKYNAIKATIEKYNIRQEDIKVMRADYIIYKNYKYRFKDMV